MINTSSTWKRYSLTSSNYQPYILVKKNGTTIWTFDSSNIKEGSVRFTDEICDPGNFTFGATISNHFEADIINFDDTFPSPSTFYGCIAELYFCLPSSAIGTNAIAGIAIAGEAIVGTTESADRILRGVYRLEPVSTVGKIVHIEGYDFMNDEYFNTANMDGFVFTNKTPAVVISEMGYAISSYPNTMFTTIILSALEVSKESGLEGITRRTVLGYLCEMCGCYARYAPNGNLVIKEFSANGTATEITKIVAEPDSDYYELEITGVHVVFRDEVDEAEGSDGYYMTIENNPFIQTALFASQIADTLYDKYNGMVFSCYNVSWFADPSFEPGDYISFEVNGIEKESIILQFDYSSGNSSGISFEADRDGCYSTSNVGRYSQTHSVIQQAQNTAEAAKVLAQAAQESADSKITTYYQDDAPTTGLDTGDLWIDTNDNNKLYRYSGSSWVNVQDGEIQTALLRAADAKSIADSKIVTFAQTSQPTATDVGDIWVDTDDNNKMYRWNGSSWSSVRDGTIAIAKSTADSALTAAQNATAYAQAHYGTCITGAPTTAKVATLTDFALYTGATVSIYFTNKNTASSPTLNVNSTGAKPIYAKGSAIVDPFFWNDSDTVTFIYDGNHWCMADSSANTIVAGWCHSTDKTYIDGGKIYANTVTADKIYVTDLYSIGATIGAFHIDSNSIYSGTKDSGTASHDVTLRGSGSFSRVIGGVSRGALKFAIGNTFAVDYDGWLYASHAVLTGGEIGGFTHDDTSIHTKNVDITSNASNSVGLSSSTFGRTIGGTYRDSLKFAVGSNFAVSQDGTLYASSANITGGTIDVTMSGSSSQYLKVNYSTSYSNYYVFLSPSIIDYQMHNTSTGKGSSASFGYYGISLANMVRDSSNSWGAYGSLQIIPHESYFEQYFTQGTNGGFIYRLGLDGSSGTVSYYNLSQLSDLRMKENVRPLDKKKSSDFIYAIEPIEYRYRDGTRDMHHGFGAQPTNAVLSKIQGYDRWMLVHDLNIQGEGDKPNYLTINYIELIADIVATLQSQNERLKALESA